MKKINKQVKIRRIYLFLTAIALIISAAAFAFACSDRENQESKRNLYQISAKYDGDKTLTADMTVNYVNSGEAITDSLYFHLYPRAYRQGARFSAVNDTEVKSAYPNGISYGDVEITSVEGEGELSYCIDGQDQDILVVSLGAPVLPTECAQVKISFTLTIPEVRHRLGKVDGVVNLGNWYPVLCYESREGVDTSPYYCIGDPFVTEVADYEVRLQLPKGYDAAVSGDKSVTEAEESKIVQSKGQRLRDFAIVIGKFDSVNDSVNGVSVTYYYQSDDNPEQSLKAATDALKTFSQAFGDYPYEHYSVVKTHFLHGGMEYPGLSMISNQLNRSLFTEAIIHETAHQWWYAVVGSDQINHAWQDEGLAEYSTTLFYQKNPDYGVTVEQRLSDATSAYMIYLQSVGKSSLVSDRRLTDFTTQLDYTFSSYVKGELMLDCVYRAIGDKKFFAAMRSYYANCAFTVATPAHLIGELERVGGQKIGELIRVWLEGRDVAFM